MVNDLPLDLNNSSFPLYVDDLKLYKSLHSIKVCETLQNKLNNLKIIMSPTTYTKQEFQEQKQ